MEEGEGEGVVIRQSGVLSTSKLSQLHYDCVMAQRGVEGCRPARHWREGLMQGEEGEGKRGGGEERGRVGEGEERREQERGVRKQHQQASSPRHAKSMTVIV